MEFVLKWTNSNHYGRILNMQPRDVVIVSACRTAIGKFQGQFKDVSARELAITAGKEAIRRAGIDINTIDEIVMGECYTAMQGSLPAARSPCASACPLRAAPSPSTRTAPPACVPWRSPATTSSWARPTSAWWWAWRT